MIFGPLHLQVSHHKVLQIYTTHTPYLLNQCNPEKFSQILKLDKASQPNRENMEVKTKRGKELGESLNKKEREEIGENNETRATK